jgi:tRNA-specific 2-thiouridylase
LCNAEIKFRAFLDHALTLGAERIATGHYARVRQVRGANVWQLLRGLDAAKDQSYFLHRLNQAQLARTLFPVGHLPKPVVREIARRIGLPNAAKKDSTGICFIGERPFREFLARYLAHRPGPIREPGGRVLGEHVGLSFYTLGQRKGIGVGGSKGGNGDAWYVARKDMTRNTLWVVQGHDHPWLLSESLHASDVHWIAGAPPEETQDQTDDQTDDQTSDLSAKTRYRQDDAPCSLTSVISAHSTFESTSGSTFTLEFPQPQWAVTPGQSAVLYRGEVCLGGGVIHSFVSSERSTAGAA